jgi:prepilin-type N-terminal cleavage/methylation domain-containing protein
MKKSRRGFTLVELAIVLVIIGLILGAILKGQELINNAKMKRLYNMKQEVLAGIYTYYDRFNAYPGDDPQAKKHLNYTNTKDGNGNGFIDGIITNCTDNSKETCALWQHLRLANILSGTGVANPRNPYGGAVAVGYTNVQGKSANWIMFDNLPRETARSLDVKYDDGNYKTGSIRSSNNYDDSSKQYTDLYFEF